MDRVFQGGKDSRSFPGCRFISGISSGSMKPPIFIPKTIGEIYSQIVLHYFNNFLLFLF